MSSCCRLKSRPSSSSKKSKRWSFRSCSNAERCSRRSSRKPPQSSKVNLKSRSRTKATHHSKIAKSTKKKSAESSSSASRRSCRWTTSKSRSTTWCSGSRVRVSNESRTLSISSCWRGSPSCRNAARTSESTKRKSSCKTWTSSRTCTSAPSTRKAVRKSTSTRSSIWTKSAASSGTWSDTWRAAWRTSATRLSSSSANWQLRETHSRCQLTRRWPRTPRSSTSWCASSRWSAWCFCHWRWLPQCGEWTEKCHTCTARKTPTIWTVSGGFEE